MRKKKIITDSFSFEKIIERNGLYVDKTRYFYNLISSGGTCYFLSRPRRFGKSLAVSIFKNIFLGRRELFNGLHIYNSDYDWQEFPVIHIDMAQCVADSIEGLKDSLNKSLSSVAQQYGVELDNANPSINFNSLISALKKKSGKNVVILIDEYDRPLTENIDNAEELEKVRRALSEFYQMIKGNEPNERFVFMTGVTRFSKISIFSKLNNLIDISMTRDYGEMFGYTQDELEKNFASYIDDYVRETDCDRAEFMAKIKKWYDGFKFDYETQSVYNPVSVGQFFANFCRFQNYWFNTATPTFITKLAKKQNLSQNDIESATISDASLNTFDIAEFASGNVAKESLIQLLFQTGYLTIDKKIESPADIFFSVRFPNYEVDVSFNRILFEVHSGMKSVTALSYVAKIIDAANGNKVERMIELFKNFMAEIPYTIQNRSPNEQHYQTIIFCILKMCGMDVEAESATNKGRIDTVLETNSNVYIIEFKLDKNADEATEQIIKREYFQKFIEAAKNRQKRIVGLGINFSTADKNITDWKMREI